MSMRDSASTGYVLAASSFTSLLPESVRAEYTKAIEDQNAEEVTRILDENAPENFPEFGEAFVFGDEDTGENMVQGEVYIDFSEEDLYKPKELNFAGQYLESLGILPKFQQWVTFG